MNLIKKFQDQLLESAKQSYRQHPPSQRIMDAFYAVPRHLFVKKYREGDRSNRGMDESTARFSICLVTAALI